MRLNQTNEMWRFCLLKFTEFEAWWFHSVNLRLFYYRAVFCEHALESWSRWFQVAKYLRSKKEGDSGRKDEDTRVDDGRDKLCRCEQGKRFQLGFGSCVACNAKHFSHAFNSSLKGSVSHVVSRQAAKGDNCLGIIARASRGYECTVVTDLGS